MLTPADRVAVNEASGTDASGGGAALPMQYVVDKAAIDRVIDTMNPVDPLSYKSALTAAYNALHALGGLLVVALTVTGKRQDECSAYAAEAATRRA